MKRKMILLICMTVMMAWLFNVDGFYAYTDDFAIEKAESLKTLGLFKGVSDTDFDLNRPPTRIEAMVMLIRNLGVEDKALKGDYEHPFTDVPNWADAYIGYAYVNQLSKGISDTEFGMGQSDAAMFLTFTLRALGYREGHGLDFLWHQPFVLARQVGILTDDIRVDVFNRSDAVLVNALALQAKIKGKDTTLADQLIEAKVFTQTAYTSVKNILIRDYNGTLRPILVENKTLSVLGQNKDIQVVTVDLDDPNIYLEVVTANDRVQGSEPFLDMINRKNPLVAINGNFFDAYSSLEPSGTIMKKGMITHMEGRNTSFVFGDRSAQIDHFSTKILGYLDGHRTNQWNDAKGAMDYNLFEIWYVNTVPYDATGVYLYTRARDSAIALPEGTAVVVSGNLVTQVRKTPGAVYIPKDGYVIYYAKDAASERFVEQRFWTGRKVEMMYQAKLIDDTILDLNQAKGMVSAGPLLVKNNTVVVDALLEGFEESKITTNRAMRSALGLTRDNRLILVTGSNLNVEELAHVMRQLGCDAAMNLDGGASSALYANGRLLTQPGRKLNTVLMVRKR